MSNSRVTDVVVRAIRFILPNGHSQALSHVLPECPVQLCGVSNFVLHDLCHNTTPPASRRYPTDTADRFLHLFGCMKYGRWLRPLCEHSQVWAKLAPLVKQFLRRNIEGKRNLLQNID